MSDIDLDAPAEDVLHDLLDEPIIGVRVCHILHSLKIRTMRELLQCERGEFMRVNNVGAQTVNRLHAWLYERGILPTDQSPPRSRIELLERRVARLEELLDLEHP